MTKKDKIKLIEALNRLDDFASFETADNDNGEAEQQEKDYNLIFNNIQQFYAPHRTATCITCDSVFTVTMNDSGIVLVNHRCR